MSSPQQPRKQAVADSISKVPRLPGKTEDIERPDSDANEGATDEQVGDTPGPGVGYDQEPEQEKDEGGVSES